MATVSASTTLDVSLCFAGGSSRTLDNRTYAGSTFRSAGTGSYARLYQSSYNNPCNLLSTFSSGTYGSPVSGCYINYVLNSALKCA